MGKALKNDKNMKTSISKRRRKLSRKELRKEKRMAKKERKNQHYQKKFLNIKNEIQNEVIRNNKKNDENKSILSSQIDKKGDKNVKNESKHIPLSFEKQSKLHNDEIMEQKKLKKEMAVQRKKQLLTENRNEDKVIRKLEKQLRLNKRKSKTLPQSFLDEGLDYLLDVCDSDKLKSSIKAEKNMQDSGSEFEEDFAVITGEKKPKRKKSSDKNISNSNYSEDESNDNGSFFNDSEGGEDFGDSEVDDFEDSRASDESGNENENLPRKKIKNTVTEKISKISRNDNENYDSEESEFSGNNFEGNEEADSTDGSEISEGDGENGDDDDVNNKELNELGVYEDIYGRKRDKHGNVIPETGKYIPPHLKAQSIGNAGRDELIARLKKQIKGLLNRLAENNMHSIVTQMDQLFMQNSRNDMNDTLTKLIFESLIQPVLAPERLIVEHTMLIAALHANVGTEVGAHFLQAVVEKFNSTYSTKIDVANKEVDNILVVLAQLYSFKVFNCALMFDVLNRLIGVDEFGEKEVELLLVVLRNVGFNLRKDDPIGLKNVILKVQSVINNSADLTKQSRVRFMLDVLTAIKNNNVSKIPNYDPSSIEHHKKILKSVIQKGKYISELNITLEDLLKAPERGRWWVVGSAWSGKSIPKTDVNPDSDNVVTDISQTYLDLAKKQRMSTDSRRNIFCIIMSAEDYMDAFEKLLRLGLKGPQEQTIIHVIVHCVVQEKTFNPYYAYLASQFCTADRKHLMTLQYHLWDRIRELSDLKGFQITNMALFLSHLIIEKALPLSVLKVIEFAALSKPYVRLLRRILLNILLHNNHETVAEVFQKISRAPKLKLFRESIRLFFHHFILRNISEDSVQMVKLKERVTLAESCMNFV